MLDILLWALFLTCAEGGMVVLARWLWGMAIRTDSDAVEGLCITALIFVLVGAVAGGIMLAASAVLGTMKLFGMYA